LAAGALFSVNNSVSYMCYIYKANRQPLYTKSDGHCILLCEEAWHIWCYIE